MIATGLLSPSATDPRSSSGLLAVVNDFAPMFLLPDPIVCALHASPDAPPVDLEIGSSTVADDLAFRSLAGPLRPTPGSVFAVDVYAGDGTTYVKTASLPALRRGGRYLAVATGLLGGQPSFRVLAVGDPDLALSVDGVDRTISFPTLTLSGGLRGYAVATDLLGESSFGRTVVDGTASPWETVQVAPLP